MDSSSTKPSVPFVKSYKTVSLSQLGNPQPVQTPDQPKEVAPKRNRQAYIPVATLPQAQPQPPQTTITPLSKNKRIVSFAKPPSLPPVQQVQQAQPVQQVQQVQQAQPVKSAKHVIE